jgi:endonuclease/exonuclease/phosphatase family metal-dependent hydrolase
VARAGVAKEGNRQTRGRVSRPLGRRNDSHLASALGSVVMTRQMRILTWNLNHRAARHKIPDWIAQTIGSFAPDVVVLTEYVTGPDHERFLGDLAAQRLGHAMCSGSVPRQNQILIASCTPMSAGTLHAPPLHAAVPPNFLHVITSGTNVFGFRLPSFESTEIPLKRQVWEWLIGALGSLPPGMVSVLAGDFNTATDDGPTRGGDFMRQLVASGWGHALPVVGASWRRGTSERVIDHVFVLGVDEVPSGSFSWAFQDAHPETRSMRVGMPDHAILVAEFSSSHLTPGARG